MQKRSGLDEPVVGHVLSGFLGAGKTTILNRMLREPAFADTMVVVNEFGEIGLDHLLIETGQDNVVLLDSGCLCCAMLGSFRDTLLDLCQRRASGALPPFARIIVETSGLADPSAILGTLRSDPLMRGIVRKGTAICTVDAVHGSRTLLENPEAVDQVVLAERLIVTKTDLVGGIPADLAAQLTALNPLAEIVSAAAQVSTAGLFDAPHLSIPAAAAPHHHQHTNAQSVAFRRVPPVGWAGIAAWTGHLVARHGNGLLRTKALLPLDDGRRPVLVQGVRGEFETQVLPAWPDAERGGRIVVIGRHLDPGDLKAGLTWLDMPDGIGLPGNASFPPWYNNGAP